jgi:hypothetical protein
MVPFPARRSPRRHSDLRRRPGFFPASPQAARALYLENNRRQLEITKHVSLAEIAPQSLLKLRETGQCEVELPEALFDRDFPGHYRRTIKSVAISVPCVAGPYTGVHATVSLSNAKVRRTVPTTPSAADLVAEDPVSPEWIVTSGGANDSDLFEPTDPARLKSASAWPGPGPT